MITFQEHTGFIRIEEYSLAAWLSEVETVINQGYTFNFESNDTHPQAFGSMYTAVLVPVVAAVVSEVKTEEAPEIQSPETTTVETTVQTKRKNAKG